jgi:cation:H+ antiporter
MEITLPLALFVLGFIFLVKGADYLVKGAAAIARIFRVSNWFIGAVIVSIGTSIPEFSVSIASAFTGKNVGIATVIGSNVFNILIVLGIVALFQSIALRRDWVVKDLTYYIVAAILTSVFVFTDLHVLQSSSVILRWEGAAMVLLLLIWMRSMLRRRTEIEQESDAEVVTVFIALVLVLAGLLGVFLGGKWVVDGAVIIAALLNIEPAIIGFTVVALGTSLPELVVSLVAIKQGAVSIAVGNVVGSSIFNLLGVLGVTALIRPILVLPDVRPDILITVAVGVLLYVIMYVGKRYTLSLPEGVLFIVLYAGYLIYLFL